MLIVTILFTIALFAVILLFSSPKFSPVPYFPSNKNDMDLILKALQLRDDQTVFDLGAGDGLVIFKAANESLRKNLDTRFVGVEINPILVTIMKLRRLFHPNKKNINIVLGDMFKMDFSPYTLNAKRYTFYLYISPWYHEKTISNIKRQFGRFDIVSYFYSVESFGNKGKKMNGRNGIYSYTAGLPEP